MTQVFHGTADELRGLVEATGLQGEWKENVETKQHTFRGKTGEVLNWWPSKGTLSFQGKNIQGFEALFTETVRTKGQVAPAAAAATAKIFVVHGHDRDARDQLELVLMRLGLKPFILQNADAESKTIIEALEQHIYREAAFGIVLMTPDDFGYAKAAGETEKQPRARQNVVLELGMVMAALGRARMVILKKGALEMPSDTNGIIFIEFNDHVREVVPKLAQRLQGAGFKIEPQAVAYASS